MPMIGSAGHERIISSAFTGSLNAMEAIDISLAFATVELYLLFTMTFLPSSKVLCPSHSG